MRPHHTKVFVHLEGAKLPPPYIRGEGGSLSWNQGVPLAPVGEGQWLWETSSLNQAGFFKVVLDDKIFELGENHPLLPGSSICINPKFPS